jgi:hypothetical protein
MNVLAEELGRRQVQIVLPAHGLERARGRVGQSLAQETEGVSGCDLAQEDGRAEGAEASCLMKRTEGVWVGRGDREIATKWALSRMAWLPRPLALLRHRRPRRRWAVGQRAEGEEASLW